MRNDKRGRHKSQASLTDGKQSSDDVFEVLIEAVLLIVSAGLPRQKAAASTEEYII